MCGIAGLVTTVVDCNRLSSMTDAIAHRGPDSRGVWISANGRIGLGHRRLSIMDLSSAGAQPMERGHIKLTFNGEIYNHLELREQLTDYTFTSSSDTEVIIAAYLRWGHDCLSRFNGMFAFALWDDRKQELFCARDRLGVKPFFYAQCHQEWLFGSEVKALLAGGINPAPDMKVWAQYLVNGAFERAHESFFDGVKALPPGHYAVVKPDASMSLRRWWYLPERVLEPWSGTEDQAAELLNELIDKAVMLRLRSDVPVAVNLSGGLDSSTITQSFLRQSHDQVHVFTCAFDDPAYDEDQYAESVIRGSSCIRHIVRLLPQHVESTSLEAMHAQEAPFGGIGMLAYERIHRQMRSLGLKVALEGQGGDELFAGYAYYASPSTSNLYQDGTSYLSPECIQPFIRDSASPINYPAPFLNRLDNSLYRDLTETKLVRVLRMNDRKSMAHGVELRQPFLDYRVVELAMRLPAHLKIRDGYGKHVLRVAMKDKLPPDIVWAKKRPVVTPQREWMLSCLKPWVEDIIYSQRFAQRGFIDASAVQRTFAKYLTEKPDNAFPIWQWINLELWFRTFVDK